MVCMQKECAKLGDAYMISEAQVHMMEVTLDDTRWARINFGQLPEENDVDLDVQMGTGGPEASQGQPKAPESQDVEMEQEATKKIEFIKARTTTTSHTTSGKIHATSATPGTVVTLAASRRIVYHSR